MSGAWVLPRPMADWDSWLDRMVRTVLFYSPLRHLVVYKYRYAFSPSQLRFLLNTADEALKAPGAFVEIGCYRGYTTVLLNKHLDAVAPERAYAVVDTFGGFVAGDVEHEVRERGKDRGDRGLRKFSVNSERLFRATLKENGVHRVRIFSGDVGRTDLSSVGAIAFALLDVDLYVPTAAALPKLWAQLSPGGLLVVDDCHERHVYDGSRQALEEFCRAKGLAFTLHETKLAVLRKPLL